MDEAFKSKLEELVDRVFELKFPSSAGFKHFDLFFSEESVSHPAKANLFLLSFLISKYTREGEVVADIMAGSGSTGIVASYFGRNSVLVELEEKFVSWIEENVKLLEKHGGKKGEIKVLKGDARKLTELLGDKADSIVTSPPYSSGGWKADENPSNPIRREKERKLLYPTRPPDPGRYSENRENIGNLSHGSPDAIITSPPYAESVNASNDPRRRAERMRKAELDPKTIVGGKARCGQTDWQYGESEGQIGKLEYVDAVITSPPYSDSRKSTKISEKDLERKIQILEKGAEEGVYHSGGKSYRTPGRLRWLRGWMGEGFPNNKQNISNLPHGDIDAIVTSPPYSESLSEKAGGGSRGNILGVGLVSDGEKQGQGAPKPYSVSQENIGNLQHGDIDAVITSPPYFDNKSDWDVTSRAATEGVPVTYSDERGNEEKKNIGNIHYYDRGEPLSPKYASAGKGPLIDAIVTSPPYEGSLEGTSRHTKGGIASRDPALAQTGTYATTLSFGVPVGYSPNKVNIGNLKSNEEEYQALVDSIITSPPYADSKKQPARVNLEHEVSSMETDTRPDTKHRHTPGRIKAIKSLLSGYSESEENIGNLSLGEVDAVITSPPYGHEATASKPTNTKVEIDRSATPEVVEKVQKLKSEEKGRSETYLQAMLTVYQECYKVLKPGGYVIIIVKPFVRNKKPVDLPYHTWLLLEKCGFKLVDVLKFRLPATSFWRVLQYSKCDHSKMVNVADGKIVHRKKKVWVDDEGKEYDKKDVKKKTECKLFSECKPKLEKKKQSECDSYVNGIEKISHEYILVCQK